MEYASVIEIGQLFIFSLLAGAEFAQLAVVSPAQNKLSDSAYSEFEQVGSRYGKQRIAPLLVLTVVLQIIFLLQPHTMPQKWFGVLSLVGIIAGMVLTGAKLAPLSKQAAILPAQDGATKSPAIRIRLTKYRQLRAIIIMTAALLQFAAFIWE